MLNGISNQNAAPPAGRDPQQAVEPNSGRAIGSEEVGNVLKNIQTKYGAKPKPGREIKKTLDKDDFLKIMMTQMQHQDPTSPFKADEMAGRMAQFATLEQLQNVNTNVKNLGQQSKPTEQLAMTNLIGKTITIDRQRFPHTEGKPDEVSFGLPKNAQSVKIAVVNEQGEVVHEKDLGALKAGEQLANWDGMKNGSSLPAKTGTYTVRVEALDENGAQMPIQSQAQGRVVGVSFQGGEPVFLVGDANHQEKVAFKSVVQIDSLGDAPAQAQGMPGAEAAAAGGGLKTVGANGGKANFFSFTPGEGSKPMDLTSAPPELAEALKRYQPQAPQKAGDSAAAAKSPEADGGFPNGLHDE